MTEENKKIISDIIPPQKRVFVRSADVGAKKETKTNLPFPQKRRRKINLKRILWTILVFLGIFSAGFFSARIEVSVAPKRVSVQLDKSITAIKNLPNPKERTVAFRTISIPYSKSEKFKATEKKSQDTKAQGKVAIFNKQKNPQILIASTRLENPTGKIYRIPSTVVIPAAKEIDGKLSPGSKEVAVIADKAGQEYNVGLNDFTFPGLKDSPKFDLVFARSKTEMSGGASGEHVVVGMRDGDDAISNLISKANSDALIAISKKLPENEFLLVNTAEYHPVKTNLNPSIGSRTDDFEAVIEGELRAAIINKKELERALLFGQKEIEVIKEANFIENINAITFKEVGYDFDGQIFNIYSSGKAEVKYLIDAEDFKKTLINKQLYDAASILSSFPGLARAEVRVRPFWISFWPMAVRRVDIILEGS